MYNGYFFSPEGELIKINKSHIEYITKYPAKFCIGISWIKLLHKLNGERLGEEGKARDIIIKKVLENGWIRLREYDKYLEIESFNSPEEIIKTIIDKLLEKNDITPDTNLKICFENPEKTEKFLQVKDLYN